MRIVFIGASRFGLRCLEHIASLAGITVAGVLTAPESFSISYATTKVTNVLHAQFAPVAARLGVACASLSGSMHDAHIRDTLAGFTPDAFLVVGWYHLIPRSIRAIAPAYGIHASLLPDYS